LRRALRRSTNDQEHTMGKGDKRSRRGKIFRGSCKTRPRRKKKPAPKSDEQKAAG
jgi:ribosomal small subunit protein bTHX